MKGGLWSNLLPRIPVPERDEVTSLIGRALIDSNEVNQLYHLLLQ
jgi:hypothetical protein